MDTIIIVLIVLVPVFLGLVGKALNKAGKDGGVSPSMTEVFPRVRGDVEVEEGQSNLRQPKRKTRPSSQPVAPTTFQTQEDERPRKKEKLDPKKLVIYSEIMKPKF